MDAFRHPPKNAMDKNRLKTIAFVLCIGITILHAQKPSDLLNQASRYESAGKLEQAREILEPLHQFAPRNVVYATRLKGLYLRMQAYDALLDMLEEESRRDPGNPGPAIEKARAFHRMGRREEAIQIWESVIDSHRKQKTVIQQVANVMAAERLFTEALEVYSDGREALKDSRLWAIQMAGLYAAVQDHAEATREYLRYLQNRPNQAMYVETSILRMPKTKSAGRQILGVLEDAFRQDENNAVLAKILSRAHLRWGHVKDGYGFALRQESLSPKNQQGVALIEFAGRLRQPEMLPFAEKAYRELLKRYPNYAARDQIWFLLGQNYHVRHEWDKALAVLDSVVQHQPRSSRAPRALMLIGQIQRDHTTDYPAADRAFKRLLKSHPNTQDGRRAHLELGLLHLMTDSLDQAEQAFYMNLRRTKPYTPIWIEASLRLAETAYYRGEFDTALAVLKEMSQPGLKPALFQHQSMNDGLALRLLIQSHMKKSPDALRLLSEAQLRMIQKRPEQAMELLDRLMEQYPQKDITAYGLLERASLQDNRRKGLADLDTLLSRFPDCLVADQALYQSGLLCEETGDDMSAMKRYERFLIDHPASVHIQAVRKRIRQLEEDV